MSAKAIYEADGKAILNYHLTRAPVIKPSPLPTPTKHNPPPRLASLHFPEDKNVEDVLNQAEVTYPWLLQSGAKFVAKPDQLIKRRGKSGLLALNKTWPEAKAWIAQRAGKVQKVEHTEGVLRQFLVEPMLPHPDNTEYYININSVRDVSAVFHCFRVDEAQVRARRSAPHSQCFGGRGAEILKNIGNSRQDIANTTIWGLDELYMLCR
jgi:ATP citrate (pro-S)-lyase